MQVAKGFLCFKSIREDLYAINSEFIRIQVKVKLIERKLTQVLFQTWNSLFCDFVSHQDQVEWFELLLGLVVSDELANFALLKWHDKWKLKVLQLVKVVELFSQIFSEAWSSCEAIQVKLKRLKVVGSNETNDMIEALLSDVKPTEVNFNILISIEFLHREDFGQIVVVERRTHRQWDIKRGGSLQTKRITQLAETANIIERLGPIGMKDNLLITDIKPIIRIAVIIVEELKIAKHQEENKGCVLVVR